MPLTALSVILEPDAGQVRYRAEQAALKLRKMVVVVLWVLFV